MNIPHLLLLILISLLIYSYIGYGLLLWLMVAVKRLFKSDPVATNASYPEVTLVVAAFNEEDCIEEKIKNCLSLDYPKDKLQLLFVTDGSTDRTVDIIQQYPHVQLEHQDIRAGKIAAVNRIMPLVATPITIFCDANTTLNTGAIKKLTQHFNSKKIGAVAGEKRIAQEATSDASTAGEGIYWRYESVLKSLDSELHSVVGAAGELFAIRTELYEAPSHDTLIEDFILTMNIAKRGYKVAYEKEAYALESGSAALAEEIKRKIRIAAGGLQAVYRLRSLLVPTDPILTFQYVSHRVLRWTLAPLALIGVMLISSHLASQGDIVGQLLFAAQVFFYAAAAIGYAVEQRALNIKILYVPLYFTMMNLCVFIGLWRLSMGSQSVVWDKAKRK
ncbi:MAG: glycosyltransferase family 2 protein [Cyclobacteriaceae bacterium]